MQVSCIVPFSVNSKVGQQVDVTVSYNSVVSSIVKATVAAEFDNLPILYQILLDLSGYEESGDYAVLREGAVPAGEIAALL